MFEFISKNKIVILIVVAVIVLGLLLFAAYLSRSPQQSNQVGVNELEYQFIQSGENTEEQEYLLLQAKILSEQYFSYSYTDVVGLLDVKNYATEAFAASVQKKINSVTKTDAYSFAADPDSLKLLTQEEDKVVISLEGVLANLTTNKNSILSLQVSMVRQGDFWKVSNIEKKENK